MRNIQKKKIFNRLKTNIRQWIMGMTSCMLLSCSKRKETRTPQTKPREEPPQTQRRYDNNHHSQPFCIKTLCEYEGVRAFYFGKDLHPYALFD